MSPFGEKYFLLLLSLFESLSIVVKIQRKHTRMLRWIRWIIATILTVCVIAFTSFIIDAWKFHYDIKEKLYERIEQLEIGKRDKEIQNLRGQIDELKDKLQLSPDTIQLP